MTGNPDTVSEGNHVTFWDDEGDRHDAVVIDAFERPGHYGAYVNLVYNPDEVGFEANTLKQLTDATSVPHVVASGSRECAWTTEWRHHEDGDDE
jgi:hypothetical protein